MECLRRIVNSNDLSPFISLPRSFLNKKIEVLITPVEEEINDSSELINSCIEDAKSRYKIVNGETHDNAMKDLKPYPFRDTITQTLSNRDKYNKRYFSIKTNEIKENKL